MQSYKAIKFYEKQTDDEIKKIAHVFSEKATFITNDNIYVLFLYSPDVYKRQLRREGLDLVLTLRPAHLAVFKAFIQ